jgi:hypothetical protein
MQMIQLVARVGHVPAALNEGQPERMKASLAETVWNLSWQDIVGAKPGTARCSHRIAKIHPPNWQNGKPSSHACIHFCAHFYHMNTLRCRESSQLFDCFVEEQLLHKHVCVLLQGTLLTIS